MVTYHKNSQVVEYLKNTHLMNNFDDLHQNRKEFSKLFFYSVAGVFAFFLILSIFFENSGVIVPIGILLSGFFLTIYTAYLLSNAKYDFITLYRILTIFLGFFLCYVSLLISDISRAIHFLFVPIVLMIMLISKFNRSVFWGVFFLTFSVFSSEISAYFQIGINKDFFADNPNILIIQEYIVFVISAYFSFLTLYYHNKFIKAQIESDIEPSVLKDELEVVVLDEILVENQANAESHSESLDNYQILYKKIIHHFETEKPYQKADFNIRKLAELVDSNSTYVSRALNKVGNKKFNQLVNDYRIEQVKKEIENNIHQKFTLETIYTNAGFSQQSTFNRIFKEYTGFTPSEYIENLNGSNHPTSAK